MKIIINSSKKRYNVSRKYALKQYENIDLYVEGLETIDEVKAELEKIDALAEEYREKENNKENVEVEINNNITNENNKEVPF